MQADRFITQRPSHEHRRHLQSHYLEHTASHTMPKHPPGTDPAIMFAGSAEYRRYTDFLAATLFGTSSVLPYSTPSRIILHHTAARRSADDLPSPSALPHLASVHEAFHRNQGQATRPLRKISLVPQCRMDAPGVVDDFYLNPLDCSSLNVLAVALGSEVYLKDIRRGTITQLLSTAGGADDAFVTAVRWLANGSALAVALSNGSIQWWDPATKSRLRNLESCHASRIPVLACQPCESAPLLTSGGKDAKIVHYDLRAPVAAVQSMMVHEEEVCGLAWSANADYLASGANDNVALVWDVRSSAGGRRGSSPLHTLEGHRAAVKALAWCPWSPTVLATGGGTADKKIRFWDSVKGTCMSSFDTGSQVSSIQWSRSTRVVHFIFLHDAPFFPFFFSFLEEVGLLMCGRSS